MYSSKILHSVFSPGRFSVAVPRRYMFSPWCYNNSRDAIIILKMLFYLSSILNFHLLSIMIIKIISPLIVIPLSRTLKAIKRLNSQVLIALRVITVWMRISQADTCDMTNTTCLQSPISTWKNAITKTIRNLCFVLRNFKD